MDDKGLIDRINENREPFLFLTRAIILDKIVTYFGLSNPDLFLREGNTLVLSNYLIDNFGLLSSLIIHGGLQEITIPSGFAKVDEIFERNHFPKISRVGMYLAAGAQCVAAAYNSIVMS